MVSVLKCFFLLLLLLFLFLFVYLFFVSFLSECIELFRNFPALVFKRVGRSEGCFTATHCLSPEIRCSFNPMTMCL